jgi:Ni2+-binding GTPase involved in maturation of urease and hydrogenase
MMGPGHSGKTAAVHWLTREMEEYQHIIEIDCNFWKSDASFIGQLIEEVSLIIKRQLLKNLVVK